MKIRFLIVMVALAGIAPAHGGQAGAEGASVLTGVSGSGTSIVVEAHGVQPEAPLFFSATVDETAKVSATAVASEMKIKMNVLQGRPEILTLGLSGSGDVVDVAGNGLKDWAVRQGADGARYLDLRPALEAGKPGPKELDVTVHTNLAITTAPGSASVLIATPGSAVGFSSRIKLLTDPDVEMRVANSPGLMPYGDRTGPRANRQFYWTGNAQLTVMLEQRGAGIADAELVGMQLTGKLNASGNSVDFRLQGEAHVTGTNARLTLLSGDAAPSDAAAGDGWRVELARTGRHAAYDLVFERAGLLPIDLTFSAAVEGGDDWRGLKFQMPAGVVVPVVLSGFAGRMDFGENAVMAATGTPGEARGFLPADGDGTLKWKPAREAAEGTLFFTGNEQTDVRVGAGLLRETSRVTLRVLQGKMPGVRMMVDGPGEILSVEGDNVVGWSVAPEGKQRVLDVRLSQPIAQAATIEVRSQSALGAFPVQAQPTRLTPEGAVRHCGYVRIANDGAVRLEVSDAVGMMQLAPSQYPGGAIGDGARQVFVYRFAAADYGYKILASQIVPEVNVSQIATYEMTQTDRVINADIELDIREAPLREWTMSVPADYSVVWVTGESVADYVPDTETTDGARNLRVIFNEMVGGRQLMHLRLEKNESASAGVWALPALRYPGAKSVRGQIGVVSMPGYRMTPKKTENLVEMPVSYFPNQETGLQQAYRVRDPQWSAAVQVDALAQSVQADVFHLYSLKEGIVYGSVLINYFVIGAPANEWRIAVPKTAGNIDVAGQNVQREWRREGNEIVVSLHEPVLGAATLLVTFEEPMSARGGEIDPGEVQPLGVQSERGYIQVVSPLQVKYTVQKATGGLLKLEPSELPTEYRLLTTAPSLVSYEYTGRPFALAMNIEWYAAAEMADQVVDFAKLSSRISRDGQVVTDARYFVKTRGEKALRMVLPEGMRLWETRVENQVVNARADGDQILIPLPARINSNEPVEVRLQLGQTAGRAGHPVLAAPTMQAPTVISEWTLHADPDRMLKPEGGNAEPRVSSVTESGFEWIAARGMDGALAMLAAVAIAGALLRQRGAWWQVCGLLVCAVAVGIAAHLAMAALSERRVNASTLSYAATVVPAGEAVTIRVGNLPEWRAMISWWGVVSGLAGVALLAYAALNQWGWFADRRKASGAIALGVALLSMGLLAQAGGAVLFFGAAGVGTALVLFLPGVFRAIGEFRGRAGADGIIPGAAVSPILLAGVSIGILIGLGHASHVRADEGPVVFAQEDGKPAEAIVQTWKIEKNRLFGTMDARVRGVVGDSFLLLSSSATLTGFTGDGLHVTKVRRGGTTAYFVAPQKDGVLTAHATFEMSVPDLTRGIPVPTGLAAVQRVTIQLDQAGWEFAADAAVSVTPLTGLPANSSGATLVLGPAEFPTIHLTPKRRDAASEKTEFFAEIANLYAPGPGVVNGRHLVTIRPAQGQVTELEFTVPEGFTVGEVHDGPAQQWRFDPTTRKLRVAIEPAQAQPFSLQVDTQQGTQAMPVGVTLEPLKIAGASGEVGTLALAFGSDVQPENVQAKGLSPADLGDIDQGLIWKEPDGQPTATVQQVFRYSGEGGSVTLKVAPVMPEVRVTTKQTLSLGDDRLVLAADLSVEITRAGIFSLSFALPEGLEVEALSGDTLSQWTEADTAGQRVITMHLTGRTIGTQTYALTLSGPAPHAQPEWKAPKLVIREATRQSGVLTLAPEEGIRLRAVTRQNVSQVDPADGGDARPRSLEFRLLQQDYQLTLAVEALEPWVTVQALQEVTMREGQTLTRVSMRYHVENAAVKQVQVRLPGVTADEARTMRATGSAVSDIVKVAGTADVWEIEFQRGIAGETDARIEYQGEAAREQGKETVRSAEFVGARRVTLFVAARASGRLELSAADVPRGWERLDWSAVPAELQDRTDRSVPALCFRVAEPEGPLVVSVRRDELAATLNARVTRAAMTTLLSPQGPNLTAAELTVDVLEKSAMKVRLPDNAQLFNTLVNGESVPVVREGDGYLFNVSPGMGSEHEAKIRMVYSVAGTQRGGIDLNGPVLNVPMQNVSWRVMMPTGYKMRDYHGDPRLQGTEWEGKFGMEEYQSRVASTHANASKDATDLLRRANTLLQNGDEEAAGAALDRAARANGLDAASDEDARVELRVLKTQQAVLGLNTRRQKLYLDNRADAQRNEQLEQAANLNPLLQGKSNYDPQQFDQMLLGNTAEENSALSGIAGRLVDQQLATEPAPGAIDVTMPEHGEVLTFTRSMQVDGNAPLKLNVELESLHRPNWGSMGLLMLGVAAVAVVVIRQPREV